MDKLVVLLLLGCVCAAADATVLPWGINTKLSLGVEREVSPWIAEDAELKYEYGLTVYRSFEGGLGDFWHELKASALREQYPELKTDGKVGSQYRVEYHLNF